jgi:hypothetical protein
MSWLFAYKKQEEVIVLMRAGLPRPGAASNPAHPFSLKAAIHRNNVLLDML